MGHDAPKSFCDDPELQHQIALSQVPPKRLQPQAEQSEEEQGDFVRYVGPSILFLCVVAFAVLSPGLALIALICLVILTPCVLLHEFAHLLTARRAGMEVYEFSLGFGNRLWSRQWKGITWSIKLLPLGGSVEIAGMTVEDVERTKLTPQQAFIYKSPLSRMWVVLSGILTNALLAWLALTITVIVMAPEGQSALFYLTAPIQAIIMCGTLIVVGVQALGNALFNWQGSEVGSILSLPQGFAAGVNETLEQGLPVTAYLLLFFAAINLSLALFNTLPLYPLDGYHGATATVDLVRRIIARIKHAPFAPLSTWRLRWFSRSTGALLAVFVASVFVRDIVRMM